MADANAILQATFPEMRWRCLSLAADLDRIERAMGGGRVLEQSPQLVRLGEALDVLRSAAGDRAARVQMIFSDQTPPPT